MAIEVFNRYEKKCLISEEAYRQMLTLIQPYMMMDAYQQSNGFYTISNLYYDTPQDELIIRSLEKPIYKEKLRLRAYGVPKADDHIYLEIKKKYKGLVNKRRTDMVLTEAQRYLKEKRLPEPRPHHNRQVLYEIQYLIDRCHLEPAVYIAYDRSAYFGDGLRITFDSNIRTRRHALQLEAGDFGEQLLERGWWLMEIKAENAMPLWLAHALSAMKIFPVSFSKYGKAHQLKMQKEVNQYA
ncbi:polyphosphate polymerase domain-containing protein [Fusibacter paucivorans]|uniref:Polyphosphate polymerase domain-containing protein n=1 Tax=Fusibacter paucivorans TaxID=76009 RepID=A0ABS5PNJ5_9FIRM|nr:polyphosphate polymerase domain-containing protein [Fusibacter paucivorans]MBS7525949.1 polyphosphate polymerase domain-containing protein [Fusibacter paucivorans]